MPHIMPTLRSPRPSHNITKEQHNRLLSTLFIILIALALLSAILYIFTHPGYHLTRLSNGDYRIEIQLSAAQAENLAIYMEERNLSYCTARDIRLPDGTFAVARISYDEAKNIAMSGAKQRSISIWRYSSNHSTSVNESGTIARVPVRVTYAEILDAIERTKTEGTSKALISQELILPNGRPASCFLTSTKLEEYRRRMHVVGANSIIIPFYFALDKTTTIKVPQDPF